MLEKPILFSAPMVRALLAGTKTQTRRVVKPWEPRMTKTPKPVPSDVQYLPDFTCYRATCPYGVAGDRLWVREAWRAVDVIDDCAPRELDAACRVWFEASAPHQPGFGRLRASMHMPRWASRITLEITGVRVERLQDISEADAKAEGAPSYQEGEDAPPPDAEHEWSYRASYRRVWETINGPGSWETNPWVWAVEFRLSSEREHG